MRDMNRVTLIGRLGRDAEIKVLPSGQQMAEFSVATSESYKGKDGQDQEKTDWHNVVVWGKAAEHAAKLTKGSRVMIDGKLQTRSWDGKDGKKQYRTEVVAYGFEVIGGSAKREAAAEPAQPTQGGNEEAEDDIPF